MLDARQQAQHVHCPHPYTGQPMLHTQQNLLAVLLRFGLQVSFLGLLSRPPVQQQLRCKLSPPEHPLRRHYWSIIDRAKPGGAASLSWDASWVSHQGQVYTIRLYV
eukprot:366128-Chlamydomonas_euryale.AAC.5